MKRLLLLTTVWTLASLATLFAATTNDPSTPKRLPPQPWHLADVWWTFENPTPHFESLDLDVTIDRDVATNVNLYIAPCGLGELSGVKFYGGL